MEHYPPELRLKNLTSEKACKRIADDLQALADTYRNHAKYLNDLRKNIKPIEDRYPVIKAAEYGMIAHKGGYCGVTACRRYAHEFNVCEGHVIAYFNRKLAIYNDNERRKRNDHIKKMARKGVKTGVIGQRFNLTSRAIRYIIKKR